MQTLKQFEKIEMNPVTELVLPVDKFSDWLFDQPRINDIKKMSEGIFKGKEISSKVSFKFNAGLISQFDKAVLLGTISEQNAGNSFFSLQHLYQTLGGSNHLTPKMCARLSKSIEKLMNTAVEVDMSEIVESRYTGKQYKIKGMLLPCKIVTAEINGNIVKGAIQLIGNLPMFDVADIKNQIARQNAKLISELPLRSTENTIQLSWFLLERVCEIVGSNSEKRKKRVHKLNTSILFETIFKKCGFTNLNRYQIRDLRETIKIILEHFKKCSLIHSFEFIKKGGRHYSIETICLN